MFKMISTLSLMCSLAVYAEKVPVYLGTGTQEGIFLAQLDSETGELSGLKNAVKTASPVSLAISKNKKFIFAVGRQKGVKEGFVSSFARSADGSLKLINAQGSVGSGACHLSLDKSSGCLFVANYGSGCVNSFKVDKAGVISKVVSHHQHEGASVNLERQKGPHAHSIYSSPDNKFVYSADLGIDKVMIYKLNAETAELTKAGEAKTPAGGGARHMVFSKNGDTLYVLNELSLTVSKFSRDAMTGGLKLEKTSTVVDVFTADINGPRTCSEIQLSADGKYLYAATRDLDDKGLDKISVLGSADLALFQEHQTDAKIPRHFGISPSGKWMLVAGQNVHKIIVHALDPQTGKLKKTNHGTELTKPMWILFP